MQHRAWLWASVLLTACASGGTLDEDGGPGFSRDDGASPDDAGPSELCIGVDCSHLDAVCTVGICENDTGACASAPRADGATCDDGDPCTTDDACAAGTCAGAALDCSAMDRPCATGVCNPATGACESMASPDGASCDDGALCTELDTCAGGVCAGTAINCSAMSGGCNTGACDPTTGACTMNPVADGTSCDDGDPCTSADACASGACGGTALDCSSLTDACNVGSCNTSGACVATPVADGTGCDDGDACTSGDACGGGTCTGAPVTTGPCAEVTVSFPAAGDTRVGAGSGSYFWRAGDYIEGTRSTSVSSVSSLDFLLALENNGLTCDTQDVELRINGVSVGSFAISGGATSVARTFSFPSIAGPTYTLRYHTVRTVASGCGASGYSNTGSTVTLRP